VESTFYRRCFQVLTAAFLGYLVWLVLSPLRSMLGWAAVLAFVLHPLHERLTRRLKGRGALSAGIITALTPFFVLAPLVVLGVVFAGQVGRVVTYLRENSSFSYADILDRLASYPMIGGLIDWIRSNATVSVAQVEGWVTDSLQTVLKAAASTGGNLALDVFGTLIGFFIMLFMLFFFLQDGRKIYTNLIRLIPVAPARRKELLKYLADVTRAVVFGSVATALIQGVLVGIGFAIAGLPSPVVFAVVAAIAAFLPSGAGVVLIPAIAYLAFEQHWFATIFLACWTVGIWLSENVLRSLLTARHTPVSTAATFIGAIGGVAAFGILGLILGPVLLAFTLAVVRFAQESMPADL
jgi:predicted PurR-regulated permease PerM